MTNPSTQFRAIIYDSFDDAWLSFEHPVELLICSDCASIHDTLAQIEEQTEAGHFAVGFLSYESAPAFDSAFVVNSTDFPLAVFAIFDRVTAIDINTMPRSDFQIDRQTPSISTTRFESDIENIKNHIARGDTYQVNHTHRIHVNFSGDALSFFLNAVRDVPPRYTAFLEWDEYAICSISPELFFKLNGNQIISTPMKGTRPRGRFWHEDKKLYCELLHSEKDRAENVMIVDMIRNDLGRIAEIGSVNVERLYTIEKYATVWQMTSTISATTLKDLPTMMNALFPCASITGAPKVRTMQIINELETTPRKIYTGTIGLLKPNRQYQFNVAIRTLLFDRIKKTAEYGVGSGIVWDSDADSEWQECHVKARVLTRRSPEFELLETMLYEPNDGIFLLDYHAARLEKSADYFDFPCDVVKISDALHNIDSRNRQKIRLLLARDGSFRIELYNQPELKNEPVRLRFAAASVNSQDIFLCHKTTHRLVYERARHSSSDCDDVILWNEKNEITETTINNIILKIDGTSYTPPVECGLLGGCFRAWLLDRGEVQEKVMHVDDVQNAQALYVINAVQGKRKAIMSPD